MRVILFSALLLLSLVFLAFILYFIFDISPTNQRPHLNLNETCKHKSFTGICKRKDSCLNNHTIVEQEPCNEGDLSIICCPLEEMGRPLDLFNAVKNTTNYRPKRTPGKIAEEMCDLYYNKTAFRRIPNPSFLSESSFFLVPNCDTQETLVKGGVDAKENEFPHMVQIGNFVEGANEIIWVCGGSLVSPQYILSAAHCQVTKEYGYAMVGTNKVQSTDEFFEKYVFSIVEVSIHPDFNAANNINDLALYKLSDFSHLRPICLDTGKSIPNNMEVIATGFGVNEENKEKDVLQKVNLKTVEQGSCSTKYEIKGRIIPENAVCAYGEGKDACAGDSGGPLQIKHSKLQCMYTLIGITSFGVNCTFDTNIPGVYTRVSSYVGWIEDIVWPVQDF